MVTKVKLVKQATLLKVRDGVLCKVILTVAMVIHFSILNQFRQNKTV